jgi:hypothetical protein
MKEFLHKSNWNKLETVDQDMFDMVMGMVKGSFINQETSFSSSEVEPSSNPLDMFTSEDIAMMTSKLNIVLTAFYDTLDAAEYENIKVILLGYLDMTFENKGMTQPERTAYLAVIGEVYDKYLLHFQFVVGELQSFLGSLDETKITAIMELIPDNIEMMTDIDITILASQEIDILFGDDSFDVSEIAQILVEIYFDINNELNPDPTMVGNVQTAVETFLIDTFALVDIVKDLDSTYLSPENIEQIVELMSRGETIFSWFTEGFETALDSFEYYSDDLFDDCSFFIDACSAS